MSSFHTTNSIQALKETMFCVSLQYKYYTSLIMVNAYAEVLYV